MYVRWTLALKRVAAYDGRVRTSDLKKAETEGDRKERVRQILDGTSIRRAKTIIRRIHAAFEVTMAAPDFKAEIQAALLDLTPLFSTHMDDLQWLAQAVQVSCVSTEDLEHRVRLNAFNDKALAIAKEYGTTKEAVLLKAMRIGLDQIGAEPGLLDSRPE